jgi:hypothetical protein
MNTVEWDWFAKRLAEGLLDSLHGVGAGGLTNVFKFIFTTNF